MTKQGLIFALIAAFTFSLPSHASDPVGIYGQIAKVEKLKGGQVKLWGTFYTSTANGAYSGPQTGFLYFNIDSQNAQMVNEVNDLIGSAGSGRCMAFGVRNYIGDRQTKPDTKVWPKGSVNPEAVDFPVSGGVVDLGKKAPQCGYKKEQEEAQDGDAGGKVVPKKAGH